MRIAPNSARVVRRKNGLEEGECSFEITGDPSLAGRVLQSLLPLGSTHPYYSWLWMETIEVLFQPTGARANCRYAGAQFESLEKPSYSLTIGMEESQIETHPSFDLIGGTPSSPENGAIFLDPTTGLITTNDAKGVFDRFPTFLAGGAKNPKGGIESFLDPVVNYRENYVTYSLPSVQGFGGISSDVPGPGFRGSLGKRKWMYMGFTYQRRGDPNSVQNRVLYEVSKEWRLSGRNGWDTDIYDRN